MATMKDFETILVDTLLYFYGKEYSEDIKEQVENDPLEVACNMQIKGIKKAIADYERYKAFINR